jgi:Putative Ig domain
MFHSSYSPRTPRRAGLPLWLLALVLAGCGGGSGSPSSPSGPPAPPLTIDTSALPDGQAGKAYSVTLHTSGGRAPTSWALSGGALPAGLALDATSGVLSGTPSDTTPGTPLTFTVTDSSLPVRSASVTLPIRISPAEITVTISPARAALTVNQTLTLIASTNDYAGVSWSVSASGGSIKPATSDTGAAVTFTPAGTAGAYTLTATSRTDPDQSASVTIGVTDLAGVYTYHNDLARDGVNAREFALTTTTVRTGTFGKLFSCSVDGAVYAQPLWVANLGVGGARRNVFFVATAHDSLYAFDADLSPCTQLWHASLIDAAHGAHAGETTVPVGTSNYSVGQGVGDITPEVGVIGTPVIDPGRATLYVVSKSMDATGTSFYQRLHAIDLATGNEKSGSPAVIAASYPGAGGIIQFSPRMQNQRAGLALLGGTIYVAWGSHEDARPWYGWIAQYTYSGAGFTQSSALNTTPNSGGTGGGIWMAGGAPAADNTGSLYVITGNGPFDAASNAIPNNDYGDSFLQLNGALGVTSWFTPTDQSVENSNDLDFGSGGSALVLNLSSGPVRHLVAGGGKDGTLYLLNGDAMGGLGDGSARQYFPVGSGGFHGIFATPAFWNNTLYLAAVNQPMLAFAFDPGTALFNTTAISQSPTTYGFGGSGPSISASGPAANGIVWGVDTRNYCTPPATGCGPAVLHAYDASSLASELWNSSMVVADTAGNAVKFVVPTIANGKVYLGTRGNNAGGPSGSTSTAGEVDVYGLKPD